MLRERALQLLSERLTTDGFTVEPAPQGFLAELHIRRGGRPHLVKLLAAASPHARGGRGSLALHWMLHETAADFVALVDLSRSLSWLLPISAFRERAQALRADRYHLDWIVVPSGRHPTQVPLETEFDEFRLDGSDLVDGGAD